MSALKVWYAEQRAAIHATPSSPLMLGGMVYGKWHLDALEQCCIPSILAPLNLASLRASNAELVFYTDTKSRDRLLAILTVAGARGLKVAILTMPDVIMEEPRPFLRLSAVQSLLVQRAAHTGRPFHMIMPDHTYSDRYFPGLDRLGQKHRNIVHGGINASWSGMASDLDRYRKDGALAIPAKDLATLGWANTEMCAMNSATTRKLPDEHYQVWRARDRIMLFNPHANPAYIVPKAGKVMDEAELTTATLDCHTRRLFGVEFHIPAADEEMVFVALSAAQPIPANNYTTMNKFVTRAWAEIGNRPEFLCYYVRATEMLAEIDETAPEAAEVMLRQQDFMQRMLQCKP